MITDRIYLESVLKIAILAVCLSFRLVRNLSDGFTEGFSPRRVAGVTRRASLVRTQADSPRRTGMTAFGFFHAFINNDYLV
jgi:hypothetical protein